jgi:hypothetical protein
MGIPVLKTWQMNMDLPIQHKAPWLIFLIMINDGDLDLYIGVNHIGKDEYTNAFRNRKNKW